MRPLTFVVALALAASLVSFSMTVACDHSRPEATTATATAGEPTTCTAAAPDGILEKIERSASLALSSVRAGVNLTRTLVRAGAHTATVIVRTVYVTATALT